MTRVCKSEEDGGRLLLLEHGRSWLWPVNFFLDRSAPQHACKWGCWWNRDIPGIIRSAGGLKIIEMEKYHCGTTLVVVAVPQQAQTDAGSN
jgi:methyltransferase OMS1